MVSFVVLQTEGVSFGGLECYIPIDGSPAVSLYGFAGKCQDFQRTHGGAGAETPTIGNGHRRPMSMACRTETTPSRAQTVLSASRRTDIPAFYMPWFMACIRRGVFERVNPFNRRRSTLAVSPRSVHSIVLWSKNFGPLIDNGWDLQLVKGGYPLFFHFTINSRNRILEPRVPPLDERLRQLEVLCRRHDPRAVTWRFDPVCFYRCGAGPVSDNLDDFETIARRAAQCGVRRCITSFMDDYAKIRKRVAVLKGFEFVYPPLDRKVAVLMEMNRVLQALGIALFTCCEKAVLAALPRHAGVRSASCISSDLLAELYGGRPSLKKDSGQRVRQGCGCYVSVDVGSYDLHPCRNGCLYCYANPEKTVSASRLDAQRRA